MNIREIVADSQDFEVEPVTVPEWQDVKIELRGLSVAEAAQIGTEMRTTHENDYAYGTVRWLVGGCFDPDTGLRAFESGDVAMLAEKSAAVAQRLATRVMQLSGQAPENLEEAVLKFIDLTDGDGEDEAIAQAYGDMRRIARHENKNGVLGEGRDGSSATTSVEPSTDSPAS